MKFRIALATVAATLAVAMLAQQDNGPQTYFILLKNQPHKKHVADAGEFHRVDRENAEARYQRETGDGPTGRARAVAARVQLDDVLGRIRDAAMDRIRFETGPGQEALAAHATGLGGTGIRRYGSINMLRAELTQAAVAALRQHPDVAAVFPARSHKSHLDTSVPSIGAPAFWAAGWTGAGETVGVIDTGVTHHKAFGANSVTDAPHLTSAALQPGFADNAASGTDMVGHGTAVAGVIASAGFGNCAGCFGMTKGAASILNLKVGALGNEGRKKHSILKEDDTLDALDWALQNKPAVKVFNYSAGHAATMDDDDTARIFDYLADTYGVTIVVSVGNNDSATAGHNQIGSPGTAWNVISVGNRTNAGPISPASATGPVPQHGRHKPDVAAPGTDISSTSKDGTTFVTQSGTSFAAPHIAGAAALLRSAGVTDALAIKALLINSPSTSGWHAGPGWGNADMNSLARLLQSAKTSGHGASISTKVYAVTAGPAFQLIRVKPALAAKATLVWNRHFNNSLTPVYNQLNITAYDTKTSAQHAMAGPTAPGDNVAQIASIPGGDTVLKVKAANTGAAWPDEPFAIALSQAAIMGVQGPPLSISCSVQYTTGAAATQKVDCTAANGGDIPVLNATAVTDDGKSMSFGTLDGSAKATASVTRTISEAAGANGAAAHHTVTLTGDAFGEKFTAKNDFDVYGSDPNGGGGGGEPGVCKQGANHGVSPRDITLPAGATSGSFGVKADAGCGWIAGTYGGPVMASGSGTGPGTVSFQVLPNYGYGNGTVAVIIVDFNFANAPTQYRQVPVTIHLQSPACTFTVPAAIQMNAQGAGGVNVQNIGVTTQAGCTWGAGSSDSWLTLTNASGTGNGTVVATGLDNPSHNPRTATVNVAGKPVMVTQAGRPCDYKLSSNAQSFPANTELGSAFTVTAPEGCPWTPTVAAADQWIQIVEGAKGAANGQSRVSFALKQNWSHASRTGIIHVATQTFTVTQQAQAACVGTVTPTTIVIDAAAQSGVIDVKAPATCKFTVGVLPAWITITPVAAQYTGDTTLTFRAANYGSTAPRAAQITIAGTVVTIHQEPFLVTRQTVTLGSFADSGIINVDRPAGVASPNVTWGPDWIRIAPSSVIPSPAVNGWLRSVYAVDASGNPEHGSRETTAHVVGADGNRLDVLITQEGRP